MMLRFLVSLLVGGCLSVVTAATGSIGVIQSSGDFRVDGSIVRGNGTVFDGNTIETTTSRSVVQMNAVQITLGPDSRARFYRDRTVLEKGAGLLRDADKHAFEAASLRIAPAAADAVIQVDVEAPGRISVSARRGGALVSNSGGVLVASLRAGTELEFDTQAGASTAVKIRGVVELRNGNYFVTDTTSRVTFQLQGAELAKYVGKQVNITGSVIPGATPLAGASQVVQAASVEPTTAGAAGGAAAGSTAAAGSHVAAIAIIGGVAVGGTVVGLAAVGSLSGEPSTSAK
jgi:hypothetical protein